MTILVAWICTVAPDVSGFSHDLDLVWRLCNLRSEALVGDRNVASMVG